MANRLHHQRQQLAKKRGRFIDSYYNDKSSLLLFVKIGLGCGRGGVPGQ